MAQTITLKRIISCSAFQFYEDGLIFRFHELSHTFCTNMANAGMDIKNLQYVMGHSDVGVTLNVYTHASFDRAAEQMARIIDFKEADMQGKQRKSS